MAAGSQSESKPRHALLKNFVTLPVWPDLDSRGEKIETSQTKPILCAVARHCGWRAFRGELRFRFTWSSVMSMSQCAACGAIVPH
jgi:hypothetical protein